jgi:uncharacterized protein YdbL (DUF1318 family)
MRPTFHRIGIATLLVLALLAVPSGFALADQLGAAKKAGSVGERPDGYLGVVDKSAGPEVKALVEKINAKRQEKYAGIAKKRGTSVKAVAALAGAKLVENASPGEYVMTSSGKWKQKPAK